MDVCKVMTDTLHFVMNHSTALIFGDWRVRLGPLEDVGLFFYRQHIQHQLSINQRSVKKKNKKKNNCVHFFAVADKNYNVFCSVFPKKFSSTR